ncbi:MAG: Rrf2 family transcriptional regulator [Rhodospirillales bacterium]|nr:Rrf2 family transcriptional regulator [Rhodospirillales bacterium]
MKLSTKGRYAVMAMVDLATNSAGEPIALSDVADRQLISLSYLEQLFGKLRRSGLVKSVRGPGGGYMVAHPYDQIRISDIILAVDEPIKANRCQSGSPGGCQASGSRCITHDLWVELTNHIYLFLNSVSLEDVINKRLLGISGAIFQRENPAAISRSPEVEHNQDVRVVAS